MTDEANLDAYLRRINHAGSIAPTLETLQVIQRLHLTAIPYENLDPLMELPVRLQLSDIEQKLLLERRGGTAFEHNLLFKAVLESLDFAVTPLAASVVTEGAGEGDPPLNHMLLLVDVGGVPYVADVGLGSRTPTAPLRLKADIEQETPHGRYRLTGGYPRWRLEAEAGETWTALYDFTLSPRKLEDFVAMNDSAMAGMRNTLRATRLDGSKRVSLHNARLETKEGTETTTRTLGSLLELREVLTTTFGVALPATDRLDPALEKALRPVPA
ncbi:MAG TPA: arylamine N-acetyltransferase [Devosia sp.]|nr:arylamine N-acetyltransferase [Devosia sp.]